MSPDEHLATRRGCGLFDFSFMGLHELRGAAAHGYLRAVQSRNPSLVAPGCIAYTLLLNDDGTVFIDATLWRLDRDSWWLFTGRPSDHAWLAGRSREYDVHMRDRSGDFAVLALQGPESGRVLAQLIGEAAVLAIGYFRFGDATLGRIGARIARIGYSGELGYEILVPAADFHDAWSLVLEAGKPMGIRECGFAAANTLRIESGYVLFEREITGGETPAELGLERLVARTPSRDREPRRRLVGLEIRDRPAAAPGLPLAHATSECISPLSGKIIALGFVASEDALPGNPVRLADGRLARVARLPFYDPPRRLPRARPL